MFASPCFPSSAARGLSARTAAAKQGKPGPSSSTSSPPAGAAAAPPPPPPTVAPKSAAPPRTPKVRQAYRRKKQSSEERKQQQEAVQQADAELRAGHEVYLSPDALAARAAAVQADKASAQAAWRHVVQPLTDLVPALLAHHTSSGRTHSTHSSSSSQRGPGGSIPTLLVVDGFNLLHLHPSTKQLVGDRMDLAQMQLHQLLRELCRQQQGTHVLLVYDAYRVPAGSLRSSSSSSGSSSGSGGVSLTHLGDRVSTLYVAGKEADTVIIDLVSKLVSREVAAQGQLGPSTPTLCSLSVHTNDNRIREAVTDAVFMGDQHTRWHALTVRIGSNTQLSETLQLVENKLQGRQQQQQQQQQQWARSVGPGQLPDPQHNTEAWAKAVLGLNSSSSRSSPSSSWDSGSDSDGDSSSGGSSKRRRRRQSTQQQQELQAEARRLAAGWSDEQLLQLSAAGGALVANAAAASAVAAGTNTPSAGDPGAAAEAAGSEGSTAAAAAAAALAAAAASNGSVASQQLDELLNMDLDSLLSDVDLL